MTPGDDPEERIAELERPLIQSANQSEYPVAAPRTGLRLGWAVLALMTVGLIVAGVAIFSGRFDGPVAGRPTAPTMVGGGGTVTENPSAPMPPARPTVAAPKLSTGAPPAIPLPDGAVSIAGVGTQRTVECADNAVTVSGVNNEVTLTGHCSRVDVSGVENIVTIDTADAIDVSGLNNRVTFRSGSPELTNSGIGNTLTGP